MSLKNKAILLVSIFFMLLSGSYFFIGLKQAQEMLQDKIADMAASCNVVAHAVVHDIFSPYTKRIEGFVSTRPDIMEAFAKRDREMLYRRTLPAYRMLKKENPDFYTMPFILPDGQNFLRMHAPELHGDMQGQLRPQLMAVVEAKTQEAGFEVGRHGSFYRIEQPVFHEGHFIGIVEFGLSSRQVIDALQERLNIPVAEYYLTDEWIKADQQKQKGNKYGKYTLLADGEPLLSQLPGQISLDTPHQELTLKGRSYILHSYSIFTDFDDRPLGGFVALQDISAEVAKKNRFQAQALLLTSALFALTLFVLYFSFGRLIGRLENSEKMKSVLLGQLEETVFILKKNEDELKKYQENLETLVKERTSSLEKSLSEVKTLRGFLPICASCKKIRNDHGFWEQVEVYIRDRSDAEFSHSICPECFHRLYPDLQIEHDEG